MYWDVMMRKIWQRNSGLYDIDFECLVGKRSIWLERIELIKIQPMESLCSIKAWLGFRDDSCELGHLSVE
jgi:hypothetical protein